VPASSSEGSPDEQRRADLGAGGTLGAGVGEAQVCVIGAGVIGVAVALELAERGVDVLVVERSESGLEASAANAGTLAVQNKPLAAVPAALAAAELWIGLSERLGIDVEYERRGGFRVAHSEDDAARLAEAVRAQRAQGAEVELVAGAELRRAAPYLDPAVIAASYCPTDGMANPLAAFRGLLRSALRLGARVATRRAVTGIDVRGDHEFVVATTSGGVRCQWVVSAAGAWNRAVAQMAGVDLPLSAEVLQASITDSHLPLFPHIVTHVRGNLTLKQQRSGRVLIGGASRGEGNHETGEKRLVRDSLKANYRFATETVPGLAGARLLRAWPGFEGRTPDKLLLAGSVGRPRGLYVLGCGGGGFTFSPLAGKIAADFITRGEVADLARPFDPGRLLKHPAAAQAGNVETAVRAEER
jgi:glycine/D-amino acid oxidase-like deaminating enzyme